jgi:hypothetical protein
MSDYDDTQDEFEENEPEDEWAIPEELDADDWMALDQEAHKAALGNLYPGDDEANQRFLDWYDDVKAAHGAYDGPEDWEQYPGHADDNADHRGI